MRAEQLHVVTASVQSVALGDARPALPRLGGRHILDSGARLTVVEVPVWASATLPARCRM